MSFRIPWLVLLLVAVVTGVSSCTYAKLLRPSSLSQLNPRVVSLVNYLPEVDDPNEAMLARLFAHGGLSHAEVGSDGVFRDEIFVPLNEFIWQPAIIVMERGGLLELTFSNGDQTFHRALLPSNGGRKLLDIPQQEAGVARIRLDQPGLYWFGCPVANHAGRGMLGLVIVEGQVPAEARLDRPAVPQPDDWDWGFAG